MKIILIILVGVLTSFYYFPFNSTLLPAGLNTKMMMGLIGLFMLGYKMVRNKTANIDKAFLVLSIYAIVISIISRFSMTYNNTPDDSYASYFMSMWVWLGGAYAVCGIIKSVHGKVSLQLLTNYLVVVCVSQCILALMIDAIPAMKLIVNEYVLQGQEFLDRSDVKRLYGIGANLDTAGVRFSLVLVMLSHLMLVNQKTQYRNYLWFYLISFFILVIVGNMVSRTTTVGTLLAVGYYLYGIGGHSNIGIKEKVRLTKWMLGIAVIILSIVIYKYNTDAEFYADLRFAFEGFFSLVETGKWDVGSNNQLMRMVVFPDNIKTWITGDGYFVNPIDVDPYYVGPITGGYYMGTDIGYLRFIYYFGLVGLLTFSLFMCKVAQFCILRLERDKVLILLLLCVHFIVWFKVSTDCFLIFALLLVMEPEENSYDEQHLSIT